MVAILINGCGKSMKYTTGKRERSFGTKMKFLGGSIKKMWPPIFFGLI